MHTYSEIQGSTVFVCNADGAVNSVLLNRLKIVYYKLNIKSLLTLNGEKDNYFYKKCNRSKKKKNAAK